MKRFFFGLLAAAFVHLLILLFGGIFFLDSDDAEQRVSVQDVDVVEDENPQKAPEKTEAPEVEAPQDSPPDMQQLVTLEQETPSLADATPALSALSLSALESALDPAASAGGDFGIAASLASGGRIGGTGSADAEDESARGGAFGLEELDQAAHPLFRSAPSYPAELRRRKVEGVVTLLFLVDAEGRVVNPTVEGATDPGFEGPALDAVRRWRFDPAVRNGKKVASKLRVPIRFSLNG